MLEAASVAAIAQREILDVAGTGAYLCDLLRINMPTPSASPARERRHAAILRAVGEHPVHSQAELQVLLKRGGIRVNQGTLSRDLRELGLVKGADGYAVPNGAAAVAAGGGDELTRMVREWLESAVAAQNQVVLRTPPAGSQPLAIAIDRTAPPGVVGTIAGDDTVLVICTDRRAAVRFEAALLDRKGERR